MALIDQVAVVLLAASVSPSETRPVTVTAKEPLEKSVLLTPLRSNLTPTWSVLVSESEVTSSASTPLISVPLMVTKVLLLSTMVPIDSV